MYFVLASLNLIYNVPKALAYSMNFLGKAEQEITSWVDRLSCSQTIASFVIARENINDRLKPG